MKNVVEYIKTESLDKGRVRTSIFLFMLNNEVVEQLTLAYMRGEVSTLESRIGVTVKHPKDKYDKSIAKKECAQRLKKERLPIRHIVITEYFTQIFSSYQGKELIIKKTPNEHFTVFLQSESL